MLHVLVTLLRDERGQDLAEYGIALAVIAAGTGLIAGAIGTQINVLWANGQGALDDIAAS